MLRRIMRTCCLFILTLSFLLPVTTSASSTNHGSPLRNTSDFPAVDPTYIYNQLFYMATHFQHREAGYDNNLPVSVNGHDEFADYWSKEASKDLAGFGPQIKKETFSIKGWVNRPAVVPAFNMEVSVPGITHPEQEVIIGCHYDGEALSTQSANDDASGCAIELGVAKAMGEYWQSHHVYPARTLRFVIFDAEEQGLFGSFDYVNNTVNGDLHNIIAMFNEEQNGIGYPLRFLGKMSNPILPFFADISPLQNNDYYPHQDQLTAQQRANITHFRALIQQAIPLVFAQFQALGYQTLTYHGNNNQDLSQPIFSTEQLNNIKVEDDNLGSSDQIPFTLAGLPCATFAGNSTYYDSNPEPWSYPFDQKEDTIQLMNTYASGSSAQSQALTLALALPGMITTWMLNQPDILGQVTADSSPVAAFSDIGQTTVGKNISFDASASYDATNTSNALTYDWDFGDGSKASGISVTHTYQIVGTYTLTLTVSNLSGKRVISKSINVTNAAVTYNNPYAAYPQDGYPRANDAVAIPTPNDTQPGQTVTPQGSKTPVSTPTPVRATVDTAGGVNNLLILIGFIGAGICVLLLTIFFILSGRKGTS